MKKKSNKWRQTSTDRIDKKTGEYIVFLKPDGWKDQIYKK